MNDFTKEELEEILLYTNCATPFGADEFKNKIQSMIDNYCDHPENNICMECLSATCEKCNKLWEINNE